MHKCARCGKEIQNLNEVSTGCACGSKIFVFDRGVASQSANAIETAPQKPAQAQAQVEPDFQGKADGRAPESYFARTTFTTEDVENIKIVSKGVFLVDVNALSKNPVVLKDDEGVYFVKIPFEHIVNSDIIGGPNGKNPPKTEIKRD